MFSRARWCLYTSAAALLGLACSSSGSEPPKTAHSAEATGSPDPRMETPASDSQGTGAYAAQPNGAHLDADRGTEQGPAAKSEGTGASGDSASTERAERAQDSV